MNHSSWNRLPCWLNFFAYSNWIICIILELKPPLTFFSIVPFFKYVGGRNYYCLPEWVVCAGGGGGTTPSRSIRVLCLTRMSAISWFPSMKAMSKGVSLSEFLWVTNRFGRKQAEALDADALFCHVLVRLGSIILLSRRVSFPVTLSFHV